ncbi:MAG TPA: hypothetical protein VHQ66_09920 [Myxococcota bacterium]|nr:hypothetical protein [Myxococcota bacterium]
MAVRFETASYFRVMVPQRAGQGAKLLGALADAGVDLRAVHAFPAGTQAQVDLVPVDAAAFTRAARRAGLRVGPPKRCFLVTGDDRVGAVAGVMAKLADAGISATATTAVSSGRGRFAGILWVKPAAQARAARALGARR